MTIRSEIEEKLLEGRTVKQVLREVDTTISYIYQIKRRLNKDGNNDDETLYVQSELYAEKEIQFGISLHKLGLELIDYEYRTSVGHIDILCKDENGYVVIEVKRDRAEDSSVGQTLGYMSTFEKSRGIIIAESFSKRVISAIKSLDITLLTYKVNIDVEPYNNE